MLTSGRRGATLARGILRGAARQVLLGLVAVAFAALPGRALADVEDLLLDLQVIPLGGEEAPAFTLESLDGKKVSLRDYRGQPVFLYFWASW